MKKKLLKLSKVFICSFMVATLLTACGKEEKQQQQQGAVQVATMTVTLGTSNLNNEYPTVVKGKTDIEIRPQISGFITQVCVKEGETVTKDQLLFTIDDIQYEAAVASAKAAVVSAQSAVETNELTVKNKRQLREKNIISEYEFQTAELALQSAKAALNQANQALINAQKNLSYANVTSPSDGVIGNIPYRKGSLVGPSSPALTTVSDISEVYAYFSLNEKEILALTKDNEGKAKDAVAALPKVKLELADGTEYASEGQIETISGVFDRNTGSASVRALFPNDSRILRSGSTGTILIPDPQENVIIVPQKATFEIQDKKFVYTVGKDKKAVQTAVKISPLNDGKTYIVLDGLKVGDVIVTEGVGTKVKAGVVVAATNTAKK